MDKLRRSAIFVRVLGTVLLAAPAWSAEPGGMLYPLEPGNADERVPGGGRIEVALGADGVGEAPFANAAGKLRLRSRGVTVQADTNGDGEFDVVWAHTLRWKVTVPIKVAGKPYDYPLMMHKSGGSVVLESYGFLDAQVGDLKIRILDGNCNGRFGEVPAAGGNGDLFMIGKDAPQPLGANASIGPAVMKIEVVEEGAKLRLTPTDGPAADAAPGIPEGGHEQMLEAARAGDARAQSALGDAYRGGVGVAKDPAEAVKWYRKAAEQGGARAQYNLGVCYATGVGVAEDAAEAVKWYQKAAAKGDADAQFNLGVCYAAGKGVPENDAEAVKWHRKAAEQGDAGAQLKLGIHYAKGEGVAKDPVLSYMWFDVAADRGEKRKGTEGRQSVGATRSAPGRR